MGSQQIYWTSLVLCFFSITINADQIRTCEPIRIEMCQGLGYNVTGMPNLVGHDLQQDAQQQLQSFTPLIQYSCSTQLRFFLCSVYVPMCTDKVHQPIGPCRPLCESVKNRCQPVLQEFGFPWPTGLNCSKFPPENNQRHMCMDGPAPKEQEQNKAYQPHIRGKLPDTFPGSGNFINSDGYLTLANRGNAKAEHPRSNHFGKCNHLRFSNDYFYINRTDRCVHSCEADILFTKANKDFAEIWVAVWAGLSFFSTLLTVLAFLVDSTQFHYPERAIIFISACYNIYSISYFIRLVSGRSSVACHLDGQHNSSILIQEGLDNINCTIVFMLLYFFGTASMVWWVVLTVTWLMASGLRWTAEAIERRCTYFHLAAWTIPSAQTIVLLVLRDVDADELTGMCYVGAQNTTTLLWFVIVPSFVYLTVGSLALLAGVAAILRSRKQQDPAVLSQPIKQVIKHGDKLEVQMARIGIFAVLYTLPATCVLAANFYEYFSRQSWYVQSQGSASRPNMEIFMLKIFMSMVIGITTGLWIWSSKSPLTVWQKLGSCFSQKKKSPPPSCCSTSSKTVSQRYYVPIERAKKVHSKSGSETVF